MDDIVLDTEREAVKAGATMMVVIQRALVIVMVPVRGRLISRVIAAFMVLMGADRVSGFIGREYARVQPQKDAEDQEPWKKVAHA